MCGGAVTARWVVVQHLRCWWELDGLPRVALAAIVVEAFLASVLVNQYEVFGGDAIIQHLRRWCELD